MIRLDRRADNDEELTLSRLNEDILPPSPTHEDAIVYTNAQRTDVDSSNIPYRRWNTNSYQAGINMLLCRVALAQTNLSATRQSKESRRWR